MLALVLHLVSSIVFLWKRFAGHTILAFDPATKIDKLTALTTERTEGIIFPLDRLTAGWTLHKS